MNRNVFLTTPDVKERMNLSFTEYLLVRFFKRARANAIREIQKYDFYSRILRDLKKAIAKSDSQLMVLADFVQQLPKIDGEGQTNNTGVKYSMQQYKEKNAVMAQIIPKWETVLEQNKEWYAKYNLYRIMQSVSFHFSNGNTAVALLYTTTEHSWDLEKVRKGISKENKPYYMFIGNNVDLDEVSAFNPKILSGIVIRKNCDVKRIEVLVSEYFKKCDICDVFIHPIQ